MISHLVNDSLGYTSTNSEFLNSQLMRVRPHESHNLSCCDTEIKCFPDGISCYHSHNHVRESSIRLSKGVQYRQLKFVICVCIYTVVRFHNKITVGLSQRHQTVYSCGSTEFNIESVGVMQKYLKIKVDYLHQKQDPPILPFPYMNET